MDIILNIVIIVIIVIVIFYLINNIYSRNKHISFFMSGGSKHKKNDRKNDNKRDEHVGMYDDRGGTHPSGMIIPKYFPQVGVLTNRVLQLAPLSSFVWLEKTDGLHNNLIIYENTLYSIIKKEPVLVQKLNINSSGQTVLDTELYEGKYYIFDASMIEGEDISSLTFPERMDKASKFVNKYKLDLFVIKPFSKIKSMSEIIEFINTKEISPYSGNKIDGVVLQRIDLPYFYKTWTCYKLKRKVMNTVDFKLFYEDTERVFYLYLYGTYLDVIKNRKKLPKINKYSKRHTGIDLKSDKLPDKLYVLFCSSYQEGLHKFKPRSRWNTEGYFKSNIDEINELMREIMNTPESFNGSIIEMSLANDGWVPMRKRDDKPFSNSYAVGLSDISVIFNPVRESNESTYFTKNFAFDETIRNPYHDINAVIRKYIIERSINPLNEKLNVLDLAGGRGADELNLYHSGAVNIFAADADREALVQYVERTPIIPTLNHEYLLKESKRINDMPKNIFINAIYAYLNEDNTKIIEDIKSRFEFPKEGFDVILMNYAIHYLCYKKQCVLALKELIKSLLKPGGLFIFSCFDGDSILEDMKSKGTLKLNSFEIKLIEPQMESDEDAVWARMALPTIDASGYRAEPLVKAEYLDLLGMNTIEHYYPLEEFDVSGIENHDKVEDYLNYINVYVMMN